MKPVLLDLFCGAGGAGMGYARAGFAIVGVDLTDQPYYPFEFVRGDALEFARKHGRAFDAIHASPPCHQWSAYRAAERKRGMTFPDLVTPLRYALQKCAADVPYIIENVPGAPLEHPVQCCGSSFGLAVRRHRLFESNRPLQGTTCRHELYAGPVTEIGRGSVPMAIQEAAIGIDWMPRSAISQAVPPAYTEHLGRQLLAQIATRKGLCCPLCAAA